MWDVKVQSNNMMPTFAHEEKFYGDKVAVLIRSQSIHSKSLPSDQEEYLNSIINYVCVNGDMQRQTLMQSPYKNFRWQVFGDKLAGVGN